MPKKLTTEEFIERSRSIHGTKYDYSNAVYTTSSQKVKIICPIHGEFEQIANSHLQAQGCGKCGGTGKLSQEEFIERSRLIHGTKYDYSEVVYVNNTTKVKIICPTHGEFKIAPGNHTKGKQGCRACGYITIKLKSSLGRDEFIKRAAEVHNGFYSYDKVVYDNTNSDVIITCPNHGDFLQYPSHHMKGNRCVKCRVDRRPGLITTEQWIEMAKSVHGDRFDYSETVYDGNEKKVKIICRVHGEFFQLANDHTSKGSGCSMCSGVKKFTNETFIEKARSIHGDLYNYDNVDYINSASQVIITCKKHGDFSQMANDHLSCRAGCPSCAVKVSKPETDLIEFVKSLGFDCETRNRQLIKPFELDGIVNSHKIAFEFNGLYYHSNNFPDAQTRHSKKNKLCDEVGYKLIHVYEDDWRDNRTIVEKTIKHALGVSDVKIHARKCEVSVKEHSSVKQFYETNHLLGSGFGLSHCLTLNGEIVAAMQFSRCYSERGNNDNSRWELVRFATVGNVVGAASRLFKSFLKANPEVKTIISYSDIGTFDGGVYEILGFIKDSVSSPDYKVIKNGKRMHKSNFRKSRLKKDYPHVYDDNKTELEMCNELKLYRIYDSGKVKWVYTSTTTE